MTAARDSHASAPGLGTSRMHLADSSLAQDNVSIACSATLMRAANWITHYGQTAVPIGQTTTQATFIQALEQTLGTVGYLYAQLQRLPEPQAYLSIATTNGAAYPEVQCSDQFGAPPARRKLIPRINGPDTGSSIM